MHKKWLGETRRRHCAVAFLLVLVASYSRPFQPKRDDGWSFVVTLMRVVRTKNGQEHESVRMEPHPPYICKSALEARHWGATYALYRVRLICARFCYSDL